MSIGAKIWNYAHDFIDSSSHRLHDFWSAAKPKIKAFADKEKEALKKGGMHIKEFYNKEKHKVEDWLHKEREIHKERFNDDKTTDTEHRTNMDDNHDMGMSISDVIKARIAGAHEKTVDYDYIDDDGRVYSESHDRDERIMMQPPRQTTVISPQKPSNVTQEVYFYGVEPRKVRRHMRMTKKGFVPVCQHNRNMRVRKSSRRRNVWSKGLI